MEQNSNAEQYADFLLWKQAQKIAVDNLLAFLRAKEIVRDGFFGNPGEWLVAYTHEGAIDVKVDRFYEAAYLGHDTPVAISVAPTRRRCACGNKIDERELGDGATQCEWCQNPDVPIYTINEIGDETMLRFVGMVGRSASVSRGQVTAYAPSEESAEMILTDFLEQQDGE